MQTHVATLLGALVAAGLAAAPATAQTLKLKVADVYPVGHTVSNSTIKPFMEELKKRLGSQVDFEYYPAEQIGKGKDLLTLTQTGVIDIGLIVPSYVADKLPYSAVAGLPGGYKSSCDGTMALYRMATQGVLAKYDFSPNGVRVLISHSFAPFQVVSRKPFENLKSFAGQKLRSDGGQISNLTIEKIGAVPIRMSAPEINEAMSRGTVDGGTMGIATVMSYNLTPYVKTVTYGESFGGVLVTYAISDASWKKLTPEMQKAFVAAGEMATKSGCEFADRALEDQYAKLRAAGAQVVRLSPEDRKTYLDRTAEIGREWASTLDKRGKPGTEVLNAFQAELRK